ncbi:MAG: FAD-dependent oxidoreductase, partial [Pseudolabrys sp.]
TEDGLPLIGAVPGIDGAYVATGHSVWGMLNAPATGEAMSELILDGAAHHVDLAPFAPGRLPPLDPVRLRDKGTVVIERKYPERRPSAIVFRCTASLSLSSYC